MIMITGWYLEFSHILIPLIKMNCIHYEFIIMVNCYRHFLPSLFSCFYFLPPIPGDAPSSVGTQLDTVVNYRERMS